MENAIKTTIRTVAEIIGCSKQQASGYIDVLEKKGLAKKCSGEVVHVRQSQVGNCSEMLIEIEKNAAKTIGFRNV